MLRQADIQRDRQTSRQAGRETHRQAGRWTDKQMGRQTDRWTNKGICQKNMMLLSYCVALNCGLEPLMIISSLTFEVLYKLRAAGGPAGMTALFRAALGARRSGRTR